MSNGAQGTAGKTRTCPHCRATILQSATVCPICRKSLRWEPHTAKHKAPGFSALTVEGKIRHPGTEPAWEYSMLLSICNEKGEEITRQMIGVGTLRLDEQRTFTLSVEVSKPESGLAKLR
ncbi:MAG: hypothetical protein Q7J25_02415 [Vicinamibacterales bacterium]|nr:hypothetical protein [Vicinamibacterales bacterium]